MMDLIAAGAVGLLAGVSATAALAARWYAWKDDAANGDVEAVTVAYRTGYARGYDVGRLDGRIDVSRERRAASPDRNAEVERAHNAMAETLIEPNAKVQWTW